MVVNGHRSITLPADPASVGEARRFVARAVADRIDDPADVVLMTSELVTNAVAHVGNEVTVTVCDGDVVRVEVRDQEPASETFHDLLHHSLRPPDTSPSGRGLRVVRALASRFGLDADDGGGKVVWFEWSPHN